MRKRGAHIKHVAALPGRARDCVSLETEHYIALQFLGTDNFGRDQVASIGADARQDRRAIFRDLNIYARVEWAKTSRGGKQYDLLADLIESTACASSYGLCG